MKPLIISIIAMFMLMSCSKENPVTISVDPSVTIKDSIQIIHDTSFVITRFADSLYQPFSKGPRSLIDSLNPNSGYKYRQFGTSVPYYSVYIKVNSKWKNIDSIYTSELSFTYMKDTVFNTDNKRNYVWFTFYDPLNVLFDKQWLLVTY